MKLFGLSITRPRGVAAAASRPRLAGQRGRPTWFRGLRSAIGTQIGEERALTIYDDLRRSFPIIDSAIGKLVRMVSAPEVEASRAVRIDLERWLAGVQVNQVQRGLTPWLETHLDQILLYGKGLGEVVATSARDDVFALTNLDVRTVEVHAGANPLTLSFVQRTRTPPYRVELDNAWLLYSISGPRGDDPHGSSILRSVPPSAEIATIIANAVGQVWQREGAPSFHTNWQPDAEFSDPEGTVAQSFLDALADDFQAVMQARAAGEIQDFFSGGKVTVSAIGSGQALMAVQEPHRAFTEQIVAALGLPAWMLGLHWSSTERLSGQQADMIVAQVEGLRRVVTPQLESLVDLRQRLAGKSGKVRLTWPAVNLRDLVETARGEAYQETARQRRIENGRRMWELGYWTQLQAGQYVEPDLTVLAEVHETPLPAETSSAVGTVTPVAGAGQ